MDGGRIVSAGIDRTIRVWDSASGKELRALKGHAERIRAIAVDVGRALLLSASGSSGRKKDNSIRLWSLETFQELTRLQGHADQVNAVAFGTHADEVISAGNDGTIRVWNSRSGAESLCIFAAEGPITALAITPDGRQVLCAGENVRLVDLPTEGDKCWIFHHPSPVTSLALSADGLRFVSGCTDSIVRLWSMTSGRFGRQVEQQVLGVKTTVRVWEPGQGERPHEYQGHVDHVTCLALSPDGRKVLSGSADRTVRLWGLPTA
jgi:WD40 repeat protein